MKKLFIFYISLLSIGITQAQVKPKIEKDKSKVVTVKPKIVTVEPKNVSVIFTTVKIGNQTWMNKNLDVTTYQNGEPIPKVTDQTAWSELTTGAYCYYNNDSATYAATYGKLYNWYAVNDRRGLAPAGWHVPSDAEWLTLINFLGGRGGKLKETGTTHWTSPNTEATNSSGWTGLPGGSRDKNGTFLNVGDIGFWWSSTVTSTMGAKYNILYSTNGHLNRNSHYKKNGFSVRYVRD